LLLVLSEKIGAFVGAEDLLAYIACVLVSPVYTARFQTDFSTPGLRIPITAEAPTFQAAAELGRRIVWLHTFDERMADVAQARPEGRHGSLKGAHPSW
jgi:hypothetical protein